MRTLSATLTAAQKAMGKAIWKVVLTWGESEYTYTNSDRFEEIVNFPTYENSQIAEILLDNSDQALTDEAFEGCDAVLSLGYTTSEGDEYSAYPPAKVVTSEFFSNYRGDGGSLKCQLTLEGIPNFLEYDKANAEYEHHKSSVKTPKDILTEILDGQPVAEELAETQDDADDDFIIGTAKHGVGQRVIIINRKVTKLSFWLKKIGSPTGDISFVIRDSQDISDYQRKVLADASTLTTSFVKYTVTWTTPATITDEVFAYCEFTNGDASNHIAIEHNSTNVKANENLIMLMAAGSSPWVDELAMDCKYEYSFQGSAGELGGGINVYSQCQSYDVVYDSEDDLIDAYLPKDSFRITKGESRQSVAKRVLSYTSCVGIWKADGKFHIFVPKIDTASTWAANTNYALRDQVKPTGDLSYYRYVCTTAGKSGASEPTWDTDIGATVSDNTVVWTVAFDYRYTTPSSTDHNFFSKSVKNALVRPNYVVVESRTTDEDQYSGYAVHQDSIDALDHDSYEPEIRDYKELALESNAQATSIAEAWIASLVLAAQRGSATVPMNVGAEIYDYNLFIDDGEGDKRTGNLGYINITAKSNKFEMYVSMGKTTIVPAPGTRASLLNKSITSSTSDSAKLSLDDLKPIHTAIQENFEEQAGFNDWVKDELESLRNKQPDIPEIYTDEYNIKTEFKVWHIRCIDWDVSLTAGDDITRFSVPEDLDGWEIVDGAARVFTCAANGEGDMEISIVNITQDNCIVVVPRIEEEEYSSYTDSEGTSISEGDGLLTTDDLFQVNVGGDYGDGSESAKGLDIFLSLVKTA